MEETPLVHMDLRAPLEYTDTPELVPFATPLCGAPPAGTAGEEWLFCFELNPEQAGRIDPAADCFLGDLVFSGRGSDHHPDQQGNVRLDAGLYLFTQQRQTLDRGECIALAIEQQKDGLWERLRLGNRLYIRCLFEDGSPVTQLFRPYSI